MITTRRLPHTSRREMKIFAVSLNNKTINEFKIWRLQDVTHFLCPFDRTHVLQNGLSAIQHVISCRGMSYHGLRGDDAKKMAHEWEICNGDASHLFHKNHRETHYWLQNKCRPNKDLTPLSWRTKK